MCSLCVINKKGCIAEVTFCMCVVYMHCHNAVRNWKGLTLLQEV